MACYCMHSSVALTYHYLFYFFFNDTATTQIYTLSLHDALPISFNNSAEIQATHEQEDWDHRHAHGDFVGDHLGAGTRSEEHTSELQSLAYLVCRLLLEKKKQRTPQRRSPLNQSSPLCSIRLTPG